jgi:hypothetical protein
MGKRSFVATEMFDVTTIGSESQANYMHESLPRYYVVMLQIHVATNYDITIDPTNFVLNINNSTLEVETNYKNSKHLTKKTLSTNNLFSLQHVPIKHMHGENN